MNSTLAYLRDAAASLRRTPSRAAVAFAALELADVTSTAIGLYGTDSLAEGNPSAAGVMGHLGYPGYVATMMPAVALILALLSGRATGTARLLKAGVYLVLAAKVYVVADNIYLLLTC